MRRSLLFVLVGLAILVGLASMSLPQVALAHGSVVTNKSTAYADAHVAAAALAMLLATPARPDGPRARPECTIVGTAGDDWLRGTRHDDVICALGGEDGVSGREGNDTLILGPGRDSGGGGAGDDVIRAGRKRDFLFGGPGNDRLYGQGGSDLMDESHGLGVDLLAGGGGDDHCLNARDGEGGDVIRGGPGRDYFWADNGDDVFSAEVEELTCG